MIFPQGRGRVRAYIAGLAAITDRFTGAGGDLGSIEQCARALPSGALADARPAGPIGFFSNADSWAEPIAGDGIVLIGDAAGANDPSLGHGLSISFRDAHVLCDHLVHDANWSPATAAYSQARRAYVQVLRAHAQWSTSLNLEIGPEADQRRTRAARARVLDPTIGGFAHIIRDGPDGLVANEAARRRLFGDDTELKAKCRWRK